jgi:hypothetical protein
MEVNWEPRVLFPSEKKSAFGGPQARDALLDMETGAPGILLSQLTNEAPLTRAALHGLRDSRKMLCGPKD